jgi:hypothetical protein
VSALFVNSLIGYEIGVYVLFIIYSLLLLIFWGAYFYYTRLADEQLLNPHQHQEAELPNIEIQDEEDLEPQQLAHLEEMESENQLQYGFHGYSYKIYVRLIC